MEHATSPIAVRTLATGEHQLAFSHADLPPRRTVDFSPHWTFTEPRWAWRVVGYRDRSILYNWMNDWNDVLERKAGDFFFDKALYRGFDAKLEKKGCAEVSCLVQRGLDTLREHGTGGAPSWDRQQPLNDALKSGRMSAVERALALRRLLADAGVEAHLAYGTDRAGLQPSPTFPTLAGFDHLFVYLPKQRGLASPMTVDATCSICAPGALTRRHRNTSIYAFNAFDVLGDVRVEGTWTSARGPEAPTSRVEVRHQARLTEDGALEDVVTTTAHGLAAVPHARRKAEQPEALKQFAQGEATRTSPLATVTSATWGECATALARCAWTATVLVPGYAARDDRGWLVPSGALQSHLEGVFVPQERTVPVHFGWDDTLFDEELELEAPAGTKLTTPASQKSIAAPGLASTVSVQPTPTGVRLRRSLVRTLGEYPADAYQEMRTSLGLFTGGRRLVLEFQQQP